MELPVRLAAKCLITCADERLLFVAGHSGRLNLPGGGLDDGEQPYGALRREIDEELPGLSAQLAGIRPILEVEGLVRAAGVPTLAAWTVFAARLDAPSSAVSLSSSQTEIRQVAGLYPHEFLSKPNASQLAKTAVLKSLGWFSAI